MGAGCGRVGHRVTFTLVITPAVDDRWLIATPGHDETLRSVLLRAADLYQNSPERLWELLQESSGGHGGDIDNPSSKDMNHLARLLGVTRPRLERLRLPSTDMQLAPHARRAYCPRCWREDDAVGRPRHFRRAWAGVLTLYCARHNVPLFPWHATRGHVAPGTHDDLTLWELTWRATQASADGCEGLRAIHGFADTLMSCLNGVTPWPSHWHGDAELARALLIDVMAIDALGNPPLIASDQTPMVMQSLVHSGRPKPEAGITDGWDRLRYTSDPGVRRMALWLVGAWLTPTWPQACRPSLRRPGLT